MLEKSNMGGGCGGGGLLLDDASKTGSAIQMYIERAAQVPFAVEGMHQTQPLQVEDLLHSLHKCRKVKSLDHALHLHACIHESGLEAHPSLGNLLVSMLMEVGSMSLAQQVFDRLVCRDVCSWNALITGYLKYGEVQHAVTFYDKMRRNNALQPSSYTFVAIMKACAMLKDLEKGHEVHVEIAMNGLLHTNIFVGSTLIDMYSKCGSLAKAQEVFNKLPIKSIVCWNALLTGYVEYGHADEALNCLKQMHFCMIAPNAVTFLSSLKACGSVGMIDEACELHVGIVRQGLETDLMVGSSLIDMYGKRAYLEHAQDVFDKLPIRNVVSWTALIAGYAEHGFAEKALSCFEHMKTDGVSPSIATFLCSIKACSNLGSMSKGQEIHAEIVKRGLEGDPMAGSTIIDMYARCGSLATAHEVFEKLVVKDMVSWTAIMAGDADHGYSEEVFSCYEQMQQDGISPSVITIFYGLHACAHIGASNKGQEIHADITRRGLLEWDLFIGSTLVDMYAKCGLLAEAHKMFDQLPFRSVAAWNVVITAHAEHGHGVEALNFLQHMQHEGVSPDANSFVSSLQACSSIGATERGREIYVEIAKRGLETDPVVGSNLINLLAKCDNVLESEKVFAKFLTNNVVMWTAIIAGYVEHGQGDKAIRYFDQMQNEGVDAADATFVCIMKACGQVGDVVKAHETHSNIIRKGLDKELPIGNALVDMYARSGLFVEAHQVLSKLPAQTAIAWTALITGYNEHGYSEEAFHCFQQMQHEGVGCDIVTIACSLEICGRMKARCKGQELHAELVKKGIDSFIGITVVDMYAKLGLFEEAQQEFGKLQVRDVVSWMALISGYSDHGHSEKVLLCFEQMQLDGFSPCAAAVVWILKACGSLRAIDMGREMHSLIVKKGLEEDLVTGSSLIDMYIKCGSLTMAQEVFNRIPAQDIVLWNALMSGYGQLGECESVFYTFDRMVEGGGKPDDVTFLIVLNACNHAGLTYEGQLYFGALSSSYGCIPTLEHYNCIVDLLGRAGLVHEAMVIIEKMPLHPGIIMWHAALGSCQRWGNVELGKYAFEHVVTLRKEDVASYVCMSNIIVNAAIQENDNKFEIVID